MPNDKFDSKSFNPQAFKYMVGRVPNLHMHEIKKSKALAGNPDIKATLGGGQGGTGYARIAMRGLLDGDAVNYDGQTDITATNTKTFEQGVVAVGRAKAWVEKDFSYDITGGVDFMQNIADQVGEYWDGIDQNTIIAILQGIFSMTGTKNLEFVENHTYDVTEKVDGKMSATTLNSAVNKACGANKKKFTLVFMHSDVATNLENMKLLKYMTYTDADGIERELALATWNGRTVLVDDNMPTEDVAKAGDVEAYTAYTTYVLGEGAIILDDIGDAVPYEMSRDPKTNGGQDTLYVRDRYICGVDGISFEKPATITASASNTDLETGANWNIINDGTKAIPHKAIAIAKIVSKG